MELQSYTCVLVNTKVQTNIEEHLIFDQLS